MTSYCGRTRPFAAAVEDIEYFRNRSLTATEGGVIFGSVKKFALGYGKDEDFGLTIPLRGIQVILKGPRSATLRTNSSGEFKLSGFPAGEYLIETKLPRQLTISSNSATGAIDILTLENSGCVGAKIYVNFEGEISGNVLDKNGEGAAGYDVTLVSADYQFAGPNDTGPLLHWTVSRDDGSYTLEGIPPGRYRLGIGIGGAFDSFGDKGQIFYPNTKDPLKSVVLVVSERKKLRNVNIPVPTKP